MEPAALPTDRGETLLELLIAVLIMGVAVVVLLGGVGTSIEVSDIHRKQATASADLRVFAEAVEAAVAASPSAYQPCAGTATYASAYAPTDRNYVADVQAVRYWDGTTFGTTCAIATDSGVQRISLRVRSVDDRASETLDLIVRKPCRSTVDFPADPACT